MISYDFISRIKNFNFYIGEKIKFYNYEKRSNQTIID